MSDDFRGAAIAMEQIIIPLIYLLELFQIKGFKAYAINSKQRLCDEAIYFQCWAPF